MSRNSDKSRTDRRCFIGGSDARIIMGGDEAALIRLWKEKRGEAEPEDSERQSNRPTRRRHRGAQPDLVRAEHGTGRHRRPTLGSAPRPSILGRDVGWVRQRSRRGVRGQIHAALVVLRRGGVRKAHGPAAAQHVGHERKVRGALDHHRRGQVDRDDHPGRRALPALSGHRRAPVLALHSDRRDPAPLRPRASAAASRCSSDRRHGQIQCLRKPITSASPNRARLAERSATNTRSRSAVSITANCTAMAMKLHGGPGSASTHCPSRSNFGGGRMHSSRVFDG